MNIRLGPIKLYEKLRRVVIGKLGILMKNVGTDLQRNVTLQIAEYEILDTMIVVLIEINFMQDNLHFC